ncbi:hypothetical protein K7H09_19305 [Halomonas sp. IOP_14]|uniref:hypothetical protein n=1 Tax=Halomonas sp. IOP_14 TaxID=2873295 RepID=UPI001E61A360|nr:hypothetical protein [Halomonas sp. IOP_14]MCD1588153.1 hypothetical protein [Halomonas sp. IOP_14]
MRKWIAGVMSLVAISAVQADFPGLDEWTVDQTIDPLTDDVRVTAGIGIADGLQFMLQCSSGNFGAIIAPLKPEITMEFITMDSSTQVSWRVDDIPAVTEEWSILPAKAGRKPVVINTNADEMAMAVMNANDRFVLRVHGITGVFSVDDAAGYIQQVLDACDIAY